MKSNCNYFALNNFTPYNFVNKKTFQFPLKIINLTSKYNSFKIQLDF